MATSLRILVSVGTYNTVPQFLRVDGQLVELLPHVFWPGPAPQVAEGVQSLLFPPLVEEPHRRFWNLNENVHISFSHYL